MAILQQPGMRFCKSAAAALALAVLAHGVQAGAVLEIDGIKGTVTTKDYVDAIAILSFTVAQGRDTQSGGSALTQLAPLTVTRYFDSATPPLIDTFFEPRPFHDWKLSVLGGGDDPEPQMTLELCDVYMTKVLHSSGGDSLVEQLTFSYGGYRLGAVGENEEFEYTEPQNATCTIDGGPTDTDGDGVPNAQDNCPGVSNSGQSNFDGDSQGNACDDDDDNDGYPDIIDAFRLDATEWLDTDGDGIGNNADLDDDNDGLSDEYELANGLDPLDGVCPRSICGSKILDIIRSLQGGEPSSE